MARSWGFHVLETFGPKGSEHRVGLCTFGTPSPLTAFTPKWGASTGPLHAGPVMWFPAMATAGVPDKHVMEVSQGLRGTEDGGALCGALGDRAPGSRPPIL